MPNFLPVFFIALGALARLGTLLWLWQSLRYVLAPVDHAGLRTAASSGQRAELLAEKQRLLVALKDLEAERESGKLGKDDYQELNTRYRGRARQVLQELDTLIASHRKEAKALLREATGQAAEARPSKSPKKKGGASSTACESCGSHNDSDAVFCKKCGTRLQPESAT
jgi:ribosomal protein L40E